MNESYVAELFTQIIAECTTYTEQPIRMWDAQGMMAVKKEVFEKIKKIATKGLNEAKRE